MHECATPSLCEPKVIYCLGIKLSDRRTPQKVSHLHGLTMNHVAQQLQLLDLLLCSNQQQLGFLVQTVTNFGWLTPYGIKYLGQAPSLNKMLNYCDYEQCLLLCLCIANHNTKQMAVIIGKISIYFFVCITTDFLSYDILWVHLRIRMGIDIIFIKTVKFLRTESARPRIWQ